MKGTFRTASLLVMGGTALCMTFCARPPSTESPGAGSVPKFEPPPAIQEPEEVTRGWKEPVEVPAETVGEAEPTIEEFNAQGVLKTIYFEFDKYNITPESRLSLLQNMEWLKEHPNYEILIEGHCDERGTDEYNLALGDRRAASAKNFLVRRGIRANRLRTISYGEERPVDPRHNEEAWAKNRRADFVIVRAMGE